MQVRRILLVFVALVSVGGPATADMAAEAGAAPSADRPFVVAFAQDTMENDWRAAQVRDVREELAKYPNVRFVYTDAQGHLARQVLDIDNLAAQGVDVLITSPIDADVMAPVVGRAYRAGIPVVLLSRRISTDDFTTFVHASNYDIGRRAARFLGETLDGKGRILVLQGIPTATTGRLRTEGFLDELDNWPELRVVAMERADFLRGLAILAVEKTLARGIEFDAIYAQSDSMASGARMALKKAGIDPASKPTVGIDYIAEAQEAILAGEQTASFVYPTFGKEGAELVVRILNGETVPKEVVVDTLTVTRDNAAQVDPIF